MEVMGRDGKYYPRTIELVLGELFERLPSELFHIRTKGTHPLYGREINRIERVSRHKLEVVLGYNVNGITRHNTITSDETIIAIYGEIDRYVTNIKEIQWQ